jgi:hypothetical protein
MAVAATWALYAAHEYSIETACWRIPKPSPRECLLMVEQAQMMSAASLLLLAAPILYGRRRIARETRLGLPERPRVGDYVISAYLIGAGALILL